MCNKAAAKEADRDMQVFLHTLFLEYATETGGNTCKCKAVFYMYKQIGIPSLELFWPCSILAKNLGEVLARGLSIVLRGFCLKFYIWLLRLSSKKVETNSIDF